MLSSEAVNWLKNRHRVPSVKSVEASAISSQHSGGNPTINRNKKNQLYEIEIVAERSKMKVHYCGYSEEHDEWKLKNKIQYIKPQFNEVEQDFSPLTEFAHAIKRKLLPSRSGDPKVRVQLPCDVGSFPALWELGTPTLELVEGEESTVSRTHTPLVTTNLWSAREKLAFQSRQQSWWLLLCNITNYFISSFKGPTHPRVWHGEDDGTLLFTPTSLNSPIV